MTEAEKHLSDKYGEKIIKWSLKDVAKECEHYYQTQMLRNLPNYEEIKREAIKHFGTHVTTFEKGANWLKERLKTGKPNPEK